ncbi:MAG: outer membrane protein transport protein [Deltaproteobacteria bacterium]|nr:outer membrane protein transport protein [Deltaproteobacteria bacterium]
MRLKKIIHLIRLVSLILVSSTNLLYSSGMESTGIGIRANGMSNCWIGEGGEVSGLFWQPSGFAFQRERLKLSAEYRFSYIYFGSEYGPKNSMPFFPSGHDTMLTQYRLEPERIPRADEVKPINVPVLFFSFKRDLSEARDLFRTVAVSGGLISTTGGGGGLSKSMYFERGGERFHIDTEYLISTFSLGFPLVLSTEIYRNVAIGMGPVFNVGLTMGSNFKRFTSNNPSDNYLIVNQYPYKAFSFGTGFILGTLIRFSEKFQLGLLLKTPYNQVSLFEMRSFRQGPLNRITVDSKGNLYRTTGEPNSGKNPIDKFNEEMKSMFSDFDPNSINQDYTRGIYYDVEDKVTATLRIPLRVGSGLTLKITEELKLYFDYYVSFWSQTFQKIDFKDGIPGILMDMDIIKEGDLKDTQEFALGGEYYATERLTLRSGIRFVPTYLKKNGVKRLLFPEYEGVIPETTVNGISVFSANPLTSWMFSGGFSYLFGDNIRFDYFIHYTYAIPQKGADEGVGEISSYSISTGIGITRNY